MPGDKERRDFGRRLSAMLLDKEMSMSDLARAVWGETRVDSRGYGAVVGKDRISGYCAGKTLPTALTARKLAKALACDVRDLLPNDAGDGGNEPVRVTLDRSDATRLRVEITRLREENARLREALIDILASLVASVDLLERGGKKAAPSDKMFEQMLVDYKNTIERGRYAAAIREKRSFATEGGKDE